MYEAFYRLAGKPFQLTPDASFYYESRVHRRAYAYLEYGAYQAEGFIVITGEIGAGKTILVQNLLAHLDVNQVVAAHLVSTQLGADDLLRSVAVALNLPAGGIDKASLLEELKRYLYQLDSEGKRVLLVVDEAQNLNARAVEELRMLSNFQLGGRALLQSFLVGQPELRRILQSIELQQFRQRVIASYHLGPLDLVETRGYVEHRLKQVGWRGDPRLEDSAYEAIFRFSEGIPRRINLLCNRALLAGFLNNKHVLLGSDVDLVAREMQEELGSVGRPGEVAGTRTEAGGADGRDAATQAMQSEPGELSRGGAAAVSVAAELSSEAPQLLARVSRLEKAVMKVIEMLRQRPG